MNSHKPGWYNPQNSTLPISARSFTVNNLYIPSLIIAVPLVWGLTDGVHLLGDPLGRVVTLCLVLSNSVILAVSIKLEEFY